LVISKYDLGFQVNSTIFALIVYNFPIIFNFLCFYFTQSAASCHYFVLTVFILICACQEQKGCPFCDLFLSFQNFANLYAIPFRLAFCPSLGSYKFDELLHVKFCCFSIAPFKLCLLKFQNVILFRNRVFTATMKLRGDHIRLGCAL
jgi:hypothetical protein